MYGGCATSSSFDELRQIATWWVHLLGLHLHHHEWTQGPSLCADSASMPSHEFHLVLAPSLLSAHAETCLRSHAGEDPWQCLRCGYANPLKSTLLVKKFKNYSTEATHENSISVLSFTTRMAQPQGAPATRSSNCNLCPPSLLPYMHCDHTVARPCVSSTNVLHNEHPKPHPASRSLCSITHEATLPSPRRYVHSFLQESL